MMAYTRRLCPKEEPFLSFRYMKARVGSSLAERQGNLRRSNRNSILMM